MSKEAMKMALEALEYPGPSWAESRKPAAAALRAALAESEQEPVGWQWLDTANYRKKLPANAIPEHWRPLYTAPTPRKPEQEPLTDLEYALDALRQMVEGMEQASVGERIDFQGYAMGGRSVIEKLRGSNE